MYSGWSGWVDTFLVPEEPPDSPTAMQAVVAGDVLVELNVTCREENNGMEPEAVPVTPVHPVEEGVHNVETPRGMPGGLEAEDEDEAPPEPVKGTLDAAGVVGADEPIHAPATPGRPFETETPNEPSESHAVDMHDESLGQHDTETATSGGP